MSADVTMTEKPEEDTFPADLNTRLANVAAMETEATTAGKLEAQDDAQMGLIACLRRYPAASKWSVLLSTTLVMEGYCTSLIASFYAFPQFRERFGGRIHDGTYQISTPWQTGLLNGAAVGSIIGLALNGWLCDRLGYRKTMILALIFMTAVIFIPFFATNIMVLEIGQVLSGIPWGMFSTLAVSYASEVSPIALRGYLTAYANISWALGQIIASAALRGLLDVPSEWSYRIAFALQWIFPVPLLIGTLFAPESPWWLVRQDRLVDARRVIRRLAPKEAATDEHVQNTLSLLQLTNRREKETSNGTSFTDCFKGVDRRRTEVACVAWAIQAMCGSAFIGYSTYFFEQAGMSIDRSYLMSIIQYVLALVGTCVAWALMPRYGRATLYMYGLAILIATLVGVGICGTFEGNDIATWGASILLVVFALFYNCTVGPVCYAIVSEGSSTRLRGKTVVLARTSYQLCGLLSNSLLPLMLNPAGWDWAAKTGFLWAGVAVFCLIWCYFRLPEFKGRSYYELNLLFEKKVPARQFKSFEVEQINGTYMTMEERMRPSAVASLRARIGTDTPVMHTPMRSVRATPRARSPAAPRIVDS